MQAAEFLFPSNLAVSPTNLKKLLIVGSCLSEQSVAAFREAHSDVIFDYVLFNTVAELPEKSEMELGSYDLQYVQLPLRHILTDSVVRVADNERSSAPIDFISIARRNIDSMLDAAMAYNIRSGLLTFVSNFIVPQGRIAPCLAEHDSDLDLVAIVRDLNVYLSERVNAYNFAFIADVDAIANSMGKRYFLDDIIYFYTHEGMFVPDWSQHEMDAAWTSPSPGRIEPVQDLAVTYENKNQEFCDAVFRQIESLYRIVRQIDAVKVVIFDLDNTMWRGQLAEHYVSGPALPPYNDGWPQGIWEAIQHLRRRGIVVCIASKNDEEMVANFWHTAVNAPFVKYDDFLIKKINWNSKADNIAAILDSLSLTPQSALFVDDNPVERESVKAALPGIRVIGSDPFVVRRILLWSPETQIAIRTDLTLKRDDTLRKKIQRDESKLKKSRQEFLLDLNCVVKLWNVESIDDKAFSRVFELVNKTNQFNTTGKRWSPSDFVSFLENGGRIHVFSVVDRFSDYGLVGCVFAQENQVTQFVMSCRVLGMDIEIAIITRIVNMIRAGGHFEDIHGYVVHSERNAPCRDVFKKSGFSEVEPGVFLIRREDEGVAVPHVTIVDADVPSAEDIVSLPEDFDPEAYLNFNLDLKKAGVDPAGHYLHYGRYEGRPYKF